MHKFQSQTKPERKARQLMSEEKLRAKKGLTTVQQRQAYELLEAEETFKRERAERAESNRLKLIALNPVVTCQISEALGVFTEGLLREEQIHVRIPFAALPKNCQMAAVVAVMSRKS